MSNQISLKMKKLVAVILLTSVLAPVWACTVVSFNSADHYFGRNLDLEYSYGEKVVITPRNYSLSFRHLKGIKSHYAMIGMAVVEGGYPLYFDATNEKGLSMAGLNFPGNAYYAPPKDGMDNVASFELIPWILSQCATVTEARELLARMNIDNENYSAELPVSPLHWMISDRKESIVVEAVKDGLKVYDNPVGVMTNNPTFDIQLFNLNNYRNVSPSSQPVTFANGLKLEEYSRGMGGIGIPGDLSSSSRFVKATFTKLNSLCEADEDSSVSQFFHILGSVDQQRGCCRLGHDNEITIYSSCVNTDKCIYYYRTYDNSRINAVNMYKEDLNGSKLISFELRTKADVNWQN